MLELRIVLFLGGLGGKERVGVIPLLGLLLRKNLDLFQLGLGLDCSFGWKHCLET